ncbi:tetratricopeptide repeat protein [Rhodohalobacter sp. 8-1]|uniref:tetratricopeptide repeat protein n=1 Tax=Rhodohalobacter sp. 8-1 TaxID=3131972 RepID=UPI0030EEADEE
MIRFFSLTAFLTVVLFISALSLADAQSNEFRIANQYMQQQKYEDALPILRELHQQYPGTYTFYDHLAETLINLKYYDEAIEISKASLRNGHNVTRTRIKLAEIYHISGDTEQAYDAWQTVLDENPRQIQIFHSVASSMMERREYAKAVDIYTMSREIFRNPSLFTNEIANAYMQSGQFEKAVNEYYSVITETPQQMSFVQQRFLRMRDDKLYSIAALELEDYLLELDNQHPAYSQLYQLLSWLLLETEEYRRAFVFARQYESRTEQTNYSLFSLGNRLRSAREYEIAADAYNYYIESQTGPVTRATEEKATTYIQWARHLNQQGLGTFQQAEDLFREAYRLNESIIESAPNYNRKDRVLTTLIDLSLDHFKEIEKANRWFKDLKTYSVRETSGEPYTLYAEGRIALFNKDYTTSRQALTRADRVTEETNLSEKARYYLSLSDFFAGDFEFAEVQLSSLERRNTSYFANNAIQLRMWIKNGIRMDSTAADLRKFSKSLQLLHTGTYDEAIDASSQLLEKPSHPFSDDLIVQFTNELPSQFQPFILSLLQDQISNNIQSPIRERLMWERAEIADQLLTASEGDKASLKNESYYSHDEITTGYQYLGSENRFFNRQTEVLLDRNSVNEMYENILLEFPEGFYAHYAREKLQQSDAQTL